VVDSIGAFGCLIEVLPGCNLTARHHGKVLLLLILEREEREMLLVVLLDGGSDGGAVGVERGQFLQISDDFRELSVGGALDDVLLYLFLLLSHAIIKIRPIIFHIRNARQRLEPQDLQGPPRHTRTHAGPKETSDEHTDRQEQAGHSVRHQAETCTISTRQYPAEESHRREQSRHDQENRQNRTAEDTASKE